MTLFRCPPLQILLLRLLMFFAVTPLSLKLAARQLHSQSQRHYAAFSQRHCRRRAISRRSCAMSATGQPPQRMIYNGFLSLRHCISASQPPPAERRQRHYELIRRRETYLATLAKVSRQPAITPH
jgi:hypothetical protein